MDGRVGHDRPFNQAGPVKALIVLVLGCGLFAGCGVHNRSLTFNGASAAGYPKSKSCVYRFVIIHAESVSRVRLLLPDGQLVDASTLTVHRLQALDPDPPPRADLRFAYSSTESASESHWVVTHPQHYHLMHPMRMLTNRRDVPRQYQITFRHGRVVEIYAGVGYDTPPAESVWVPALAIHGSDKLYRLPLTEAELVELFGPVRDVSEWRSF